MNFAAFTFLAYAVSVGVGTSHLLEFTDNEAAEFATDRGKSRAPGMHELVRRRNDEFVHLGVGAASTRVTSIDNDVADRLSRGGEQLQDALRIAREAGLPLLRLQVPPVWRGLPQSSKSLSLRRRAFSRACPSPSAEATKELQSVEVKRLQRTSS